MEQQNKPVSTSSHRTEAISTNTDHSRQPQHRLQQTQLRQHRDTRKPSASVPFPTSPSSHNDTHEPLSISEPSLRFPRPVGSRYLASWITNSNPNIMRVESQQDEASGLADSTYEMISGVDDSESWSQDDNDHEDMSESISSLEPRLNSDIYSVADTEQEQSEDEFTPVLVQPPASHPTASVDPAQIPIADDDSDSDIGEEGNGADSQSSLDYTQQILGTPSMAPKEHRPIFHLASELSGAMRDAASGWIPKSLINLKFAELRTCIGDEGLQAPWPVSRKLTRSQVLSVGLLVVTSLSATLLSGVFIAKQTSDVGVVHTSEVPTALHLPSASTSTSPSWPLSTQHSGTEVKPREDGGAVERLLNFNKPHVPFTIQSRYDILAHVPLEALDLWKAEPDNCVTFRAMRDGTNLASCMTNTKDGFVLRIPRSEARGDIEVILESTCKPTLRKVANIHYPESFWEGFVGQMARATHEFRPVAQHGFEDLKRTLLATRTVWDRVLGQLPQSEAVTSEFRRIWMQTTAMSAKNIDRFCKSVGPNVATAWEHLKADYAFTKSRLGGGLDQFQHEAYEYAADVADDTQVKLRASLLNAQISARLSWLKLLGKQEEYDEYQRKAAVYVVAKEQDFRMRPRNAVPASRPMLPFLTKVKRECKGQ